jgi:hypothetical protein
VKRIRLYQGKARPAGAGSPRQNIEVLDTETNERTEFECIRDAARALGIRPSGISMYFANHQKSLIKADIFSKSCNLYQDK